MKKLIACVFLLLIVHITGCASSNNTNSKGAVASSEAARQVGANAKTGSLGAFLHRQNTTKKLP